MATKDAKETPKRKVPNPGFVKPQTPDEVLAAIVGTDPLPRTEIVKKLWAYIKSHKLQDKKIIKADAKLKALFDGKDEMDMFTMNKAVSAHLVKSEKPKEEPKKKKDPKKP